MDASAGRDSDADLMRETAAGNREAFTTLYARHHLRVFRFARLMTGSTPLSEDVVQDVFLSLMRQAHQFDPNRGTLTTYLYSMARYQVRRHLLRQRRLVALDTADAAGTLALQAPADPFGDAARRETTARVRRAILTLPSRYREVVVLCDVQELSYADAAATLGCAIGTVRSRLHRARHLLSSKLASLVAAGTSSNTLVAASLRCVV
jgi:RNA polymerase sigma-70 factor (ECF subfamily)